MRKVIAAINLTLDGFCDHTAGIPDEEIHAHYAHLINQADVILYGSITYKLMQFWQPLVKNPSGQKPMDDFALAIDKIEKIVFSNSLKSTDWESASIAEQSLAEVINQLKLQLGNNILVGSRSLIIQLLKLNLIDELQLCYHPVVAGGGLPLFQNLTERTIFKLLQTKTFAGGAVLHYYQPIYAK